MLDFKAVERIKEYLEGNFKEDFEYSVQDRRYEMLEFLEQVIELGELADEVAGAVIFKGQLGAMAGIPSDKEKK